MPAKPDTDPGSPYRRKRTPEATSQESDGRNGRPFVSARSVAAASLRQESLLPPATTSGRPAYRANLSARLEKLGAAKRRVRPQEIELMLAENAKWAFSGRDWLFELKYDGYRLLAARDNGRAILRSRRGSDVTATFPEIARAVEALPFTTFVLDGEVVALDGDGRPSFQRLQKRAQLVRSLDIERATVDLPVTGYLFDVLAVEGYDVRRLPLVERKRILRELLRGAGALRFTDHVEERGEELFAEIGRLGLEGMVAKKKASPYRAGRSADWLKLRHERTGDFAVAGFTDPKGSRAGVGALHLAVRLDGGFRYAGRVGTGFGDRLLGELRARLENRLRARAACAGPVPRGRKHHWVEPEIVCEVRFREWTEDRCLRQPVFVRLREDKSVDQCTAEGAPEALAEVPGDSPAPTRERAIPFTKP